jgi:hypothetical protein
MLSILCFNICFRQPRRTSVGQQTVTTGIAKKTAIDYQGFSGQLRQTKKV